MDRKRILLICFGLLVPILIFSIAKIYLIPLVIGSRLDEWVFFSYTLLIALVVGFLLGIICYREDSPIVMGLISILLLVSGIIIQILNSFCLVFYGLAILEVAFLILGVFVARMVQKSFFKRYN